MINRRGLVVVFATSALSLVIGFNAGSFKTDRAWHADWTRLSSTGMICKGDKWKPQ
jgi:hypothetical protein